MYTAFISAGVLLYLLLAFVIGGLLMLEYSDPEQY